MADALPFPTQRPPGYEWLEDEPVFDPSVHLALEPPARVTYLEELGYTGDEIEDVVSRVAVSSPIRVLSGEGAEVMLDVARNLRPLAKHAGERIERTVRSGCYRSRWLRDLCISPDVTDLLCDVFDTQIAPHTMPVQLGHLNFEPTQLDAPVDKWHHDTLAVDYVMTVTDPTTLDGGEFEYFIGTKSEAAALAAEGRTPPRDRVVVPEFPGPGYVIALHGNMVVHRGAALRTPGERITMVNGYVLLDTSHDDQSRMIDLLTVDDPDLLFTEWARHAAWRARSRLDALIESMDFGTSAADARVALESAIVDVSKAIEDMNTDAPAEIHHYEKHG